MFQVQANEFNMETAAGAMFMDEWKQLHECKKCPSLTLFGNLQALPRLKDREIYCYLPRLCGIQRWWRSVLPRFLFVNDLPFPSTQAF